MTERDDGGPAFPGYWENDGEMNAMAPDGAIVPPMTQHAIPGMSLRDYFAAKAMEAILANSQIVVNDKTSISSMAYQMADAMLAERKK